MPARDDVFHTRRLSFPTAGGLPGAAAATRPRAEPLAPSSPGCHPACPRGQGEAVSSRDLDGRAQFRCATCRRGWHEGVPAPRLTAASVILAEIAEGVASRGRAEKLAVVLKTYVWPQNFQAQLEGWCAAHGFRLRQFSRRGPHSSETESWLRFTRLPAAPTSNHGPVGVKAVQLSVVP